MGSTNQHFSTVIVTGKGRSQTRSFTIKTKYLIHWKSYMFSALGFIGILIASLVGLYSYSSVQGKKAKSMEEQLARLEKSTNHRLQATPSAVSTKDSAARTESSLSEIQSKMKKINEYLQKRGVKGFSSAAIGGDKESNDFSPKERLSLYNEYLVRVLTGLKTTPLGYPHVGSITSRFGYRPDPVERGNTELHAGMDIRGDKGETVRSTANGKVIWADWYGGYGNCVRIAHGNGYSTLYGHLSALNVKNGQSIQAGDIIGYIGSTGRSTAPHLHYEVRLNNKPINPNRFLSL